ncbi:MAG: hypothetical protein DHS20C15_23730 [Planctomycetota bacterium]|nr:MAG: hypothetical protein DHS20C15_23730 [Planctomycetota bacterium]
MSARWLWIVVLAACASPSCIVLSDHAGVPVSDAAIAGLQRGRTTRQQALDALGPPSGLYRVDLLRSAVRLGDLLEEPTTPGRVDRDVLAWQEVNVDASVFFLPVLFAWGDTRITRRTLVLWFDADDVLKHMAFREEAP